MRRVILESPFGSNPQWFTAYARMAVRDSLSRDEAPLASHLLYTQPGILNDAVADERRLGIDAGFEWYSFAEGCVVYADFGISGGMQQGIDRAESLGIQIDYRRIMVPRDFVPGLLDAFPKQFDWPAQPEIVRA